MTTMGEGGGEEEGGGPGPAGGSARDASIRRWDRRTTRAERRLPPPRGSRPIILPENGAAAASDADDGTADGGAASVVSGSAAGSVADSSVFSFRPGRGSYRRADADDGTIASRSSRPSSWRRGRGLPPGSGSGVSVAGSAVDAEADDDDGTMATIGPRTTSATRGTAVRTVATRGTSHSDSTFKTGFTKSTLARRSVHSRASLLRRGGSDCRGGSDSDAEDDGDDDEYRRGGGGRSVCTSRTEATSRTSAAVRARRRAQSLAQLVWLVFILVVYAAFQMRSTRGVLSERAKRMRAGEAMEAAREDRAAAAAAEAEADGGAPAGRFSRRDGDEELRDERRERREDEGASNAAAAAARGAKPERPPSAGGDGRGRGRGGRSGGGRGAYPEFRRPRDGGAGGGGRAGGGNDEGRMKSKECSATPTLHDLDPSRVARYDELMGDFVRRDRGLSSRWYRSLSPLRLRGSADPPPQPGTPPAAPRFVTLDGGGGEGGGGAHLAFDKITNRAELAVGTARARAWDGSRAVVGPDGTGFEPPTEELLAVVGEADGGAEGGVWRRHTVRGDFATYLSWFPGNYGHYLHDHLPILAWLRENVPPSTKFLLRYHPRDETILNVVDPDFVRERVVWVQQGKEVFTVVDGTLGVLVSNYPARNSAAVRSLRRWLAETKRRGRGGGGTGGGDHARDGAAVASTKGAADGADGNGGAGDAASHEPPRRSVIYYTRRGSADTHHGRVVDAVHERHILALIRSKMVRHGLDKTHKVVVYDGREDGQTMAVSRQEEVFRTADAAIGPHGSGLANVVWMMGREMSPTSDGVEAGGAACDEDGVDNNDRGDDGPPRPRLRRRPQVLEYLLGPDSTQVQPDNAKKAGPGSGARNAFKRSYYYLYSSAPWIEYRHVLYAANSTNARTFVDLRSVAEALDAMWGPTRERPRVG